MFTPGVYKHYKGNHYHASAIVIHSETLEEMVVYRALYEPYDMYVRPRAMFEEHITVDGVEQPRFKLEFALKTEFGQK
jgi:hypothetical protein